LEPLTASLTLALALAVLAGGAALGYVLGRKSSGTRGEGRVGRDGLDATHGFNYLLSDDIDRAIEAFTRVTQADQGALEIYILLGNLYRQKGQVEAAVNVHRGLLERRDLPAETRALALQCLALDFQEGGLVDRAISAFQELTEAQPNHVEALKQLERLYEDSGDWAKAYETARRLASLESNADSRVLAFLQNAMGEKAIEAVDVKAAERHFEKALDLFPGCLPASVNLGSLMLTQKRYKKAKAVWEQMLARDPAMIHLIASKLREVYQYLGEEEKLVDTCLKLEAQDPGAWRGRMILGELAEAQRDYASAFMHYGHALKRHPQALGLHQRIWNLMAKMKAEPATIEAYLDLCEDSTVFADRYVCVKCHYRATELLWRCPSCHQWSSFVEE